jgi:sulfate transport system permease protein
MPLQVQKLMEQGYDSDAFALASLLTLLALVTLGLKVWLERKTRRQLLAAVATGIVEHSISESDASVTRQRELKNQ